MKDVSKRIPFLFILLLNCLPSFADPENLFGPIIVFYAIIQAAFGLGFAFLISLLFRLLLETILKESRKHQWFMTVLLFVFPVVFGFLENEYNFFYLSKYSYEEQRVFIFSIAFSLMIIGFLIGYFITPLKIVISELESGKKHVTYKLRSIIPTETISDLSSTFYLRNKKLCFDWEQFVYSNQGKVNGKVSSWAIYFHGSIPKYNSTFQIKKSTLTNGNLVLPSQWNIYQQSILIFSEVTCLKSSFVVRGKSLLDKLGVSNFRSIHTNYSCNHKLTGKVENSLIFYLTPYLERKALKEYFYNKSTKQLQFTFNQIVDSPSIIEDISLMLN